MNITKIKFKQIITIAMVCALMVVTCYPYSQVNALENSDETQSLSISDYKVVTENLLEQDKGLSKETLSYMEEAVGKNDMIKIINNYKNVYSEAMAYQMVSENLKSIYQEVESNNFTEEQANALFVSAANLEAGTAEMSKMEFSSQIPNFAPSHSELTNLKRAFVPGKDESTRSSYEKEGIGYEVMSKSGYNKTTSFLTAGSCNVNDPKGRAGYMFYTIYSNGEYQDIGIGYFGGKWQAFVSGYWTGWGIGTVSIKADDYLYFKLWIGTDNKIYFQILDGNNFNNIKFQGSYSTAKKIIPASGNGVNFNRQVTLVDPLKKAPASGLYLYNASFSQSHLYNNNVPESFNASNVDAKRKGKFGCTWADVYKVTINSKTNWHSENISLLMR